MEMNANNKLTGKGFIDLCTLIRASLILLAAGVSSCMHNEGTTTYTYEGSGLYLTVAVRDYYRSRLYLSDEKDIYGTNYVDIDCPISTLTPSIIICFNSGHPKAVNIIDWNNRVTYIKSSDIDIQVSSHLEPKRQKRITLLDESMTLYDKVKIDEDSNASSDQPYMWGEIEWWGDSTIFLSSYLMYSVADHLNWVNVYKSNCDDCEDIWLGRAKVVNYDFSWKTFFYKVTKIR